MKLPSEQEDTAQISVVIPTYKRMKDLDRCLDSTIVQTTLPKEVWVVDNGTNKETRELVERRKREFKERGISLDYVKNEIENSLTLAKNIGVKHSTGDIVSFLDDDLVLDKNYYHEIMKVYGEKPNALGIMGYNYSVRIGEGVMGKLLDTYTRLFQISSFMEEEGCRLLPSFCVTSPRPDPNRIIPCEWLSGCSTYKKTILEEIKSDVNLTKYSWGEDTDLSYRIFKKCPDSLFLTSRAKYWHQGSVAGRRSPKELTYMAEVYGLYLFHKNIDQKLRNKLIYLRSRIGRLVLKMVFILIRSESKLAEIKDAIEAPFYCIRHFKEIKKGDLRFFNETLT